MEELTSAHMGDEWCRLAKDLWEGSSESHAHTQSSIHLKKKYGLQSDSPNLTAKSSERPVGGSPSFSLQSSLSLSTLSPSTSPVPQAPSRHLRSDSLSKGRAEREKDKMKFGAFHEQVSVAWAVSLFFLFRLLASQFLILLSNESSSDYVFFLSLSHHRGNQSRSMPRPKTFSLKKIFMERHFFPARGRRKKGVRNIRGIFSPASAAKCAGGRRSSITFLTSPLALYRRMRSTPSRLERELVCWCMCVCVPLQSVMCACVCVMFSFSLSD